MINFLRCLFCRVTVQEQLEMDLYEAQINLLNACKEREYHEAIEAAMKIRIAHLEHAVKLQEPGL